MTTATIPDSSRVGRRIGRTSTRTREFRVGRLGIGTVGVLTILISAWGGIVPYIGPAFGYSADGTRSWHWSLTHTVLSLVPGAIGLAIGVLILRQTRGITAARGRISLTMAGLLAVLCGAWFIIGPAAWPVIESHGSYFVAASPLRQLANQVGYALGTGAILLSCGGFVLGWAARHQHRAGDHVAASDDPVHVDAGGAATAS